MRLIFSTTKNTEIVPFNNQSSLNGTINKWLGEKNKWHDISGNYNISGLLCGKQSGNGLIFPKGAKIVISSLDKEFIQTIIEGIRKNPIIKWGMQITGSFDIEMNNNIHNGKNFFYTLSPILLKRKRENGECEFVTYESENANEFMTNIMKERLKKFNPHVNLNGFSVEFVSDYQKTKKIKNIIVKNVKNTASVCPIMICGSKETVEMCYFLGIGRSTNSGFGCISKNKIW